MTDSYRAIYTSLGMLWRRYDYLAPLALTQSEGGSIVARLRLQAERYFDSLCRDGDLALPPEKLLRVIGEWQTSEIQVELPVHDCEAAQLQSILDQILRHSVRLAWWTHIAGGSVTSEFVESRTGQNVDRVVEVPLP